MAAEDQATKKKHVLVVDDESSICELLALSFDEAGYTVDTAQNGREALDRVHTVKPDAVILDLFMPVMDGITFLKYFRSESRYNDVPVIVVTGCHREAAMRDIPITSFFQKPVMFEDLLREVERSFCHPG